MFNYIYDNLFFKYSINKKYVCSPYYVYKNLLKSQFYNYEEIKKLQDYYLEKLLDIVNNNSDFYKNKFKKPITHDDIRNPAVYITKREIIEKFNRIYLTADGKEYAHITSGSTGEPLKIISSSLSEAHRIAHFLRFLDWWGIKPSSRNVLIWGKMKEETDDKLNLKKRIKNIFFKNDFIINVFDLNKKTLKDYYNKIKLFKPYYIRGYTSAVYQLAKLIEEEGFKGEKLGIKVAIVTSEVLSDDCREYIENVLKCRIANEYGAAEIGLFAVQCPEGNNMHICEELNYITTTETGDLIVTDLHNTATPLINYRIGDSIKISDERCKCGRGLRVISKINGRQGDFIMKTNGELISQYLIYYIFKDMGNIGFTQSISKYKVIQNKFNFKIFIEKGKKFNDKSIEYLIERMKEEIGQSISVNVKIVDEIPREPSGKLRFFQRIK